MIATLATAATHVILICTGSPEKTKFNLNYDQQAGEISNVKIGSLAVPRVGDDIATNWRGTVTNRGANFRFVGNPKNDFKADMQLESVSESSENYRLSWTIVFGEGQSAILNRASADCIMVEGMADQSKSKDVQ